jgi:phage terminase large subunit-like protein
LRTTAEYTAIAEQYIADVMSGKEMVCRMRRLHIERHVRDLAASADFEYYFDPAAGARVVKLFETVKPSKWPTRMKAEPWLIADLLILWGWKEKAATVVGIDDDGAPVSRNLRRFRVVYRRWPRKTGKSALGSVEGIYMTGYDGESGAEVYSAALTEEQARRVFDEAVAMVEGTPELREDFVKVGDQPCRRLRHPATHSEFRPLSRDKESMEGQNTHCFVGDEIHKWPLRGAWDVQRYSMRARKQPMAIGITTAPSSDDTTSICNTLDNYAEKVLTGEIDDRRFYASILEIDQEVQDEDGNVIQQGDEWDDETKWKKACPNLGVTVKLEDMRQEALEASNDPESLNAFQRYALNIRVGSLEKAIQLKAWKACAIKGDPVKLRAEAFERLKGRICFAALDLSVADDTSALPLIFPPLVEGDRWEIVSHIFIPGDDIKIRMQRDAAPYELWRDQGFVTATPGPVVDFDVIADRVVELSQMFDLRELAYDPALASGFVRKLIEGRKDRNGQWIRKPFHKDKIVKFQQTMMNYASPCGDFKRAVQIREIVHSGDPALAWQVGNLRWIHNHTGLFMPDKQDNTQKIDGAVASIMAYGRATHPDNAKLIKATPKVTVL